MSFCRGPIKLSSLVSITLLLAATRALAADSLWDNVDGGTFSVATNWVGGVPGLFDVARFETTNSSSFRRTYNVDFTNNPTNDQLVVEDDDVTFALFEIQTATAHTYTLRNSFVAAALGTVPNRSGNLTVTNGTVILPFQSDLEIAPVAGATGALTVTSGGQVLGSPDLLVGLNGDGIIDVNSGGDVVADRVIIGVNHDPDTPTGTATIAGAGSTLLASELTVGKLAIGTLNIQAAGTVESASAFIGSDNNGFGFGRGTVNVEGAGAIWTINGQLSLGQGGTGRIRIRPGATVTITGKTDLFLGGLVNLEGGTLSTSAISFVLGGTATKFEWTSGTLHVETFNGNLLNEGGVLAPGHSAGTTQINGDYNQLDAAVLQIEIDGVQFDLVNIQGNAFLGAFWTFPC
jgi:T5SS/PEP-CTERM-associated repeat protein